MSVALIWERKVVGKKRGSAFSMISFVNKLLSNCLSQRNKQTNLKRARKQQRLNQRVGGDRALQQVSELFGEAGPLHQRDDLKCEVLLHDNKN